MPSVYTYNAQVTTNCLYSFVLCHTGKVIITCLPPISTEGLTSADVTGLSERARDLMAAVLERTSDEVHARAKQNHTPQPS